MPRTENEEKNDPTGIVSLQFDGMLDIRQAGELKQTLVQALEKTQSVILQAQAVERADTAGLQLLTAFFIDARAKEIGIVWQSPSEPLIKAAELLGLTKVLSLGRKYAS